MSKLRYFSAVVLAFWLLLVLAPGFIPSFFFELYHLLHVEVFYVLYAAMKVVEYYVYSSVFWFPLAGLYSLLVALVAAVILISVWLPIWILVKRINI